MRKKILYGLVIAFLSLMVPFFNTYAAWQNDKACQLNPDAAMCNSQQTAPNLAIIIINIVIGGLGVIAVINIVISGYRYTTDRGDPGAIAKARNGIIFSVAGLIVALLAFAIVNFIASNISA